jgi:enamine deaminase RidA (YjgF/YER057c/UK114 family)
MTEITRLGTSRRWSDVVIHAGVARWVEVADDLSAGAHGQIGQVLHQIDKTLEQVGSDRDSLIEVLIFLDDLKNVAILNEIWDEWVPEKHPPIRACVQAGLGPGVHVEMVITAAVNR